MRKRKLSASFLEVESSREISSIAAPPSPESKLANLTRSVRGIIERITSNGSPDPTNTVINGATTQSKPFLRNLFKDLQSQGSRLGENLGLVSSIADAAIFNGGLSDDRQYQVSTVLSI